MRYAIIGTFGVALVLGMGFLGRARPEPPFRPRPGRAPAKERARLPAVEPPEILEPEAKMESPLPPRAPTVVPVATRYQESAEAAAEAAARRIENSEYGTAPTPSSGWLSGQVGYYDDFLNLNETQRIQLAGPISEWWTCHYELMRRVDFTSSPRSEWEALRRSAQAEHRQRWNRFLDQIRPFLSESQMSALEHNYPGQFSEYDPAADD